jgi:hypothetical protein
MSSSSGNTAYNPNDPLQANFLSALALGETGGSSNAAMTGVNNVNLAGAPTDAYGFPEWQGVGNSHAAGTFQFEPSTWDSIASTFGLNFQNASDQAEGAWYYAEQVYAQNTGGDLETALKNGDYQSIQSALASVWPSVTGDGAAPQGLAADLTSKTGATVPGMSGSGSTSTSSGSGSTSSGGLFGGAISTIENFFVRGGLIVIGGIVIIVALWQILSNQGVVPSPSKVASSAGDAVKSAGSAALAEL